MFGSSNGQGWTEVHYKNVSSTTPQLDVQMDNFMAGVVTARAALLGEDCYVVGARISYPVPNGIASNGRRKRINGMPGKTGAAAALSLAIEMQNATFDRKKIIHLRGFWDDIEYDESYHGELFADWQLALEAYIAALKNGYGWPSRDTLLSAKGDVDSYAVGLDQRVTFTLSPDTPMPLATVGTKQFVRFSKFHNSRSAINDLIQVVVDSQLLLTTVQPVGVDKNSGTGRYNFRMPTFIAYAGSDSISLGERRMGRPLNRRPGRSRAKPKI